MVASAHPDTQTAAIDIQRAWRGHEDRKIAHAKADARAAARREYLQRASMLEACVLIQTRMRIVIAKLRLRLELARQGKQQQQQQPQEQNNYANVDSRTAAAALDIQRAWRGHEDRKLVQRKSAERERARRAYFDRANLLEACVLIQTRMRIVIAKLRRRMMLRDISSSSAPQQQHNKTDEAATVTANKHNVEQEEDQRRAAAIVDIQRTWRGHEDRKIAKEKAEARAAARREYVQHANMLEACVLIQTRMRIVISKMRKRMAREESQRRLRRGQEEQQQKQKQKAEDGCDEASASASAAAVNIQRTWRGHEDRKLAKEKAEARAAARRAHLAKANLLEACLLIQTRMRIAIARMRLRMKNKRQQQQPQQQPPVVTKKFSDPNDAATFIQKNWRGHEDRTGVVRAKTEARNAKRKEYFARANMLEACVLIQSRMRIVIAKARLRILKRQRERHLQEQLHQQQQQRPPLFIARPPAGTRASQLSFARSGYTLSTLSSGANDLAAASAPVSTKGSPENSLLREYQQRVDDDERVQRQRKEQEQYEQQQQKMTSITNHTPSSPSSVHVQHQAARPSSASAASPTTRNMYTVPPVARTGFYQRSVDENPYRRQRSLSPSSSSRGSPTSRPSSSAFSSANRGSVSPAMSSVHNASSSSTANYHHHHRGGGGGGNVERATTNHFADSETVRAFVDRLASRSTIGGGRIAKAEALAALIECCSASSSFGHGGQADAAVSAGEGETGGDMASVVISVWDSVVPFSTSGPLTAAQLTAIMNSLRTVKTLSETN